MRAKRICKRAAGHKAFAAPVAGTQPFTIFLPANGIGNALNALLAVLPAIVSLFWSIPFSKTPISRSVIGIASFI